MMNTACMYLSEALNKHLPSSYPRLHSLRSLSLGLRRTSLSEAVSLCCAWWMGINPTPTLAEVACSQGCSRSTQTNGIPTQPRRRSLAFPQAALAGFLFLSQSRQGRKEVLIIFFLTDGHKVVP